jgi:hypothetical protein
MPYRVDYRESVQLTESQHDTVISAIESWVSGASNRRFPYYQRHRERGETEVHVIVDGLTYDEVATMQEQIKSGIESLPNPDAWPDPTTAPYGVVNAYETQSS